MFTALIHETISGLRKTRGLSNIRNAVAMFKRDWEGATGRSQSGSSTQLPPCDFVPPPYTGPAKAEVLAMRQRYVNPGRYL